MTPTVLARLCLLIPLWIAALPASAQSILLDSRTATYGNPWATPRTLVGASGGLDGKLLVTGRALPAKGEFEILGPLNVQADWPGSTSKATRQLAEQAKGMGANAVVEVRAAQAFVFPAVLAPRASGIAVRINDDEVLRGLIGPDSTWE